MAQQDVDAPSTAKQYDEVDKELAHKIIQHGGDQSIPKERRLKRAIQQHPQRELPRVESIDPDELPPSV